MTKGQRRHSSRTLFSPMVITSGRALAELAGQAGQGRYIILSHEKQAWACKG